MKFQGNTAAPAQQHANVFLAPAIKLNRTRVSRSGSSLASSCTCRAERKHEGQVVVAIKLGNSSYPWVCNRGQGQDDIENFTLVKRRTTNVQFRETITYRIPGMVLAGPLGRQAHFLQKFGVSLFVVKIFEQRIDVDLRQSGVSLFVGTLQPLK